ncbi:DUF349 domain-containing protein [Alteromonas pelagimontana]|uniref:DUF349 domain-containing protein n=1 Tax=Alteromonas pelagimontana TaxID=1858656 RepID=A0A6M4MIL0_9ALTE|nr:DUF349 domain-containing protein [Alteromonas pelagimontana]QJR82450.1 DUF349 domain-containing protein [Alteromonas pelagimontana]
MIFSRIFSPSHTSANPKVRLQAIAKLSPEKPADKSVLHELAFNDDSTEVTLAALDKLNSFALWQKMSQIARDPIVKKRAEQHVESAILEENSRLSLQEKRNYLLQSASPGMLRKVLMQKEALHDDADLVMQLLNKINKSDFLQQYFLTYASAGLKQRIIATVDDIDFLQKLQRKEQDSNVIALIEQRIAHLQALVQKPQIVERDTTLVLSKMQALTEKMNFPEVKSRHAQLTQDYQQLAEDFSFLDNLVADNFRDKYRRISAAIERHSERLRPRWEAEEAKRVAQQRLQEAQEARAAAQDNVNCLFNERLSDATIADVETANASVRNFERALSGISASDVDRAEIVKLSEVVASLLGKMDNFSAQQQAGIRLKQILDTAKELPQAAQASEDDWQQWRALETRWKETCSVLLHLPEQWQNEWREIQSSWQSVVKEQQAEQEQDLRICRKQLSIINNLIDNGRFRVAMGKFNQLAENFAALPASAQSSLSRRFEQTKEQIERLEGWQNYIAKPRKPALLAQAEALADAVPEDVHARAENIKLLRQQWQSLGSTGDDGDEKLNLQFDENLEKAFVPCREYFAKQDELREQAKTQRIALIEYLESLAEDSSEAELHRSLESAKKQWRSAGQVDRQTYEKLRKRWESALAPHADRIAAWHQQNKQKKQALIEKVKVLLESNSLDHAGEQARLYQEAWKDVASAGRRHEAKLWRAFKELNDALFTKLKQERQAKNNAISDSVASLAEKVDLLKGKLPTQPVSESEAQLAQLEAQAREHSGKVSYQLNAQLRQVSQQIEAVRQEQELEQKFARLDALLEALEHWQQPQNAAEQIPQDCYQRLDKRWQQAFLMQNTPSHNRAWLTTMLEVTLGVVSPQSAASQRQDVQLALMTAKLEKGESTRAEDVIEAWLSHGPVKADEKPLLERFRLAVTAYQELVVQEKGEQGW